MPGVLVDGTSGAGLHFHNIIWLQIVVIKLLPKAIGLVHRLARFLEIHQCLIWSRPSLLWLWSTATLSDHCSKIWPRQRGGSANVYDSLAPVDLDNIEVSLPPVALDSAMTYWPSETPLQKWLSDNTVPQSRQSPLNPNCPGPHVWGVLTGSDGYRQLGILFESVSS